MKAPCYKCDHRHPGCHMTCADYIAYSDGRMAMLKRQQEDKSVKAYIVDQLVAKRKERNRRKK